MTATVIDSKREMEVEKDRDAFMEDGTEAKFESEKCGFLLVVCRSSQSIRAKSNQKLDVKSFF